MKSSKVVLGVMTSFAAGAVLGILFAPKKGKKTRKLIVGKSEECADVVKEKINTLMEAVNEQCMNFCQEAEFRLTKKVSPKLEEVTDEVNMV